MRNLRLSQWVDDKPFGWKWLPRSRLVYGLLFFVVSKYIRMDQIPSLSKATTTCLFVCILSSIVINGNPRKRRTHPLCHLLLFPFHVMWIRFFFFLLILLLPDGFWFWWRANEQYDWYWPFCIVDRQEYGTVYLHDHAVKLREIENRSDPSSCLDLPGSAWTFNISTNFSIFSYLNIFSGLVPKIPNCFLPNGLPCP